jgi:hypothetical protein
LSENEEIPQHFVVDTQLWETLKGANPEKISRICKVSFDGQKGSYQIPMLDELYGVYPRDTKIVGLQGGERALAGKHRVELTLFLLHYLLGTKETSLEGKRVSEKELKGGEMFFRGPHTLPVKGIIEKFGRNPQGFMELGLKLGGKKVELGDASIELAAAPKIPVTYVLWAEDDEFPASVSILFDPTIQEFLPLDIIYGATIVLSHRLVEG